MICIECKKQYEKTNKSDDLYCGKCNDAMENFINKRISKDLMDIPAGKRVRPKRNGKYVIKEIRKKHEYKHELFYNL